MNNVYESEQSFVKVLVADGEVVVVGSVPAGDADPFLGTVEEAS
jgi:hypothetical protein